MNEFAKIDPSRLKIIYKPVQFRTLNLEQYLACYEASGKDGYRKEVRKKKDDAKIELIRRELNA